MNGGPWWRDAVMYEVYLRSFADGTADGVDAVGLREEAGDLSAIKQEHREEESCWLRLRPKGRRRSDGSAA